MYCTPHSVIHMQERQNGIDSIVHDLIILHLHSSQVIEGAPLYVATDLEGLNSVLACLASHHRPGKNTLFNRCRSTPSAAATEWCKFQNVEADFIYATGGYVDGDRPIPEILPKGERRGPWVPQWEERLPEMLAKGELVAKCTCVRDHFEPHAEGCPERLWNEAKAAAKCTRPPKGWSCSRPYGHPGPCAASQTVPGAEMIGIVNTPPQSYDEP